MTRKTRNFDAGAQDPFEGLEVVDTATPAAPLPPELRRNNFGGKCDLCKAYVEAQKGQIVRVNGRWQVRHEGDCPTQPTAGRIEEDGMYLMPDGTVVKVQVAVHGSGRLYAKKLVVDETNHKGRFSYVPGLVHRLTPDMKMTLKQAKQFGHLYGFCCVCGRTLTDEVSIAAGIGPICGSRF